MSSCRPIRQLVVAALLGVLVGGGLMAVTPAGAEVSQAVATNWKKIWKKNLKPLADRRYYTKAQSDTNYSTKTESDTKYQPKGSYETAGSGYTKAESDARYAGAGSSYSKAEIDGMLAPFVNSVAATAGGNQNVALTGVEQVIRSVSIMPPANGTVLVTSSAYVVADGGAGNARCSLTTDTEIDFSFMQFADILDAGESEVIAGTRGFAVTKGNLLTVNLVCDGISGTPGIRDSALTAIYAPS